MSWWRTAASGTMNRRFYSSMKQKTIVDLRSEIARAGNPKKASFLKRFFKTGPGEYAEGDVFIGISVPRSRALAKLYRHLPYSDGLVLLRSPIHEERLIALFLLIDTYQKGDDKTREEIFREYLAHTKYINNWDLVDSSADKIVGAYLLNKPTAILTQLAHSSFLWERRIAMISTFAFLKTGQFDQTVDIAETLLADRHDLIQKAVGWMLREMGKRNLPALEELLSHHALEMGRTALRYAIERFPEEKRQEYLKMKRNFSLI